MEAKEPSLSDVLAAMTVMSSQLEQQAQRTTTLEAEKEIQRQWRAQLEANQNAFQEQMRRHMVEMQNLLTTNQARQVPLPPNVEDEQQRNALPNLHHDGDEKGKIERIRAIIPDVFRAIDASDYIEQFELIARRVRLSEETFKITLFSDLRRRYEKQLAQVQQNMYQHLDEPLEDFKNLLLRVTGHPEGSERVRQQYEQLRQGKSEDVIGFLRSKYTLFRRAYPHGDFDTFSRQALGALANTDLAESTHAWYRRRRADNKEVTFDQLVTEVSGAIMFMRTIRENKKGDVSGLVDYTTVDRPSDDRPMPMDISAVSGSKQMEPDVDSGEESEEESITQQIDAVNPSNSVRCHHCTSPTHKKSDCFFWKNKCKAFQSWLKEFRQRNPGQELDEKQYFKIYKSHMKRWLKMQRSAEKRPANQVAEAQESEN